jgi:predicted metal-dependent TIM-barrel fold hydrolase
MMLRDVLDSNLKHKEKVTKITEDIYKNNEKFKELIELFRSGNDVTKGTCAEVMKFVSQQTPEVFPPYLDELIEYINYKAPRVKWGIPEAIGHLAKTYPDKVTKAVPKLLENTKNESTVVRWCSAFGLSNIAKYNLELQDRLLEKFKQIIEIEQNNGVKNVYLRILKQIKK